MAFEFINLNGDTEGIWTEFNFEDGTAWPDTHKGSGTMEGAKANSLGNVSGDTYLGFFAATTLSDADTITKVEVVIRARVSSTPTRSVDIVLNIGGGSTLVNQTLDPTFDVYTVNHADWNDDWTKAELDAATVTFDPLRDGGKPAAVDYQLAEIYLRITYTSVVSSSSSSQSSSSSSQSSSSSSQSTRSSSSSSNSQSSSSSSQSTRSSSSSSNSQSSSSSSNSQSSSSNSQSSSSSSNSQSSSSSSNSQSSSSNSQSSSSNSQSSSSSSRSSSSLTGLSVGENWYLREEAGDSCNGPASDTPQSLSETQGSYETTRNLNPSGGVTWNRVESSARSIAAGTWTLTYYYSTDGGGGAKAKITCTIQRWDGSCTSSQETIMSIQTGNLISGASCEENTTTFSVSAGQIDFSAGDILIIVLEETNGNRNTTLCYDGSTTGDGGRDGGNNTYLSTPGEQ